MMIESGKAAIIYRPAIKEDILCLSVLLKQVYIQTYGTEGVSLEFARFITQRFSEEALTEVLRVEPGSFIVASFQNNLIGAAQVVYDTSCPIRNKVLPELSKLYVLEWFCGKGVGYRLLQEAELVVRNKGFEEIWLWAYVKNPRAIKFYNRQGYQLLGNAFFQMEVNRYENQVLKKEL
jgi:GNAT superfamily N-acetyltransferase